MPPSVSVRLLDLPGEALLQVLATLPLRDLLHLQGTCRELRTLARSDSLWRQVAVTKWGALAAGQKVETSWFDYCGKRISHRLPTQSPLGLIQERFTDPWAHIVCCLCCCRTSGSAVISDAITDLLGSFPTPTALLQAEPDDVKRSLFPLGLQDTRYTSLRRMSEAFLHTSWADPCEFYGCGKFISDSWRIFCCGHLSSAGVSDANLKAYLRWANGAEAQPNRKPKAQRSRVKSGTKRKAEGPTPEAQGPRRTRAVSSSKAAGHGLHGAPSTPEQTAPGQRRFTRRQAAATAAGVEATTGRATRPRACSARQRASS